MGEFPRKKVKVYISLNSLKFIASSDCINKLTCDVPLHSKDRRGTHTGTQTDGRDL
jgi:hypothetical protein